MALVKEFDNILGHLYIPEKFSIIFLGFQAKISTFSVFYHKREPPITVTKTDFSYDTQLRSVGTSRCQF